MKRHVLLHSVLIALPTFVLCAAGVYFLIDKVPKLERAQKAAVTRQYREEAESLFRNPARATHRGPRGKGWRQTGKIAGRVPWGHAPSAAGEIVWVGERSDNVAQVLVGRLETPDVARALYVFGSLTLFILAAMTLAGIGLFVRSERVKDEFMAATAHDLTTPLAAMQRLIGVDDEYAKTLNERMLYLVRNVTDFLRLNGRRPRPKRERFEIGEAYFEAYHVFAEDFSEEPSGSVTVEGDTSLVVEADRMMTLQILWNLLGNDLKYAAPHGPVKIRIASPSRFVEVDFVDVGPGMTPRQRRHAFDRYYRAKSALRTGKGGFGIGLSTAREFARAMGGNLTVRGHIPHGCVFTLTLPRAV